MRPNTDTVGDVISHSEITAAAEISGVPLTRFPESQFLARYNRSGIHDLNFPPHSRIGSLDVSFLKEWAF
jgi:hypothetical protein